MWRVEKTKMKDRSGQAGHWQEEQQRGQKWLEKMSEREQECWEAIDRIRARVHPPLQSARSSHFPPFHHLWPSQTGKTSNNTTMLTQCTTEPGTTLYVGLITAWSSGSDYQGRRLNALAGFVVGLCARPAKKIWNLEFSAHESWYRCSAHARDKEDGGGCWPPIASAHVICLNTKEEMGSSRTQSRLIS